MLYPSGMPKNIWYGHDWSLLVCVSTYYTILCLGCYRVVQQITYSSRYSSDNQVTGVRQRLVRKNRKLGKKETTSKYAKTAGDEDDDPEEHFGAHKC